MIKYYGLMNDRGNGIIYRIDHNRNFVRYCDILTPIPGDSMVAEMSSGEYAIELARASWKRHIQNGYKPIDLFPAVVVECLNRFEHEQKQKQS